MAIDTTVDYSIVDVYPTFANCESLSEKEKQENCFGDELVAQLEELILLKKIRAPAVTFDTVYVDLSITKDNKIKIFRIDSSDAIKDKIPDLDSILMASVNQLPMLIQPAIKRGIPVNSQFKLPILIKVKD
jgi:hypothetical protein